MIARTQRDTAQDRRWQVSRQELEREQALREQRISMEEKEVMSQTSLTHIQQITLQIINEWPPGNPEFNYLFENNQYYRRCCFCLSLINHTATKCNKRVFSDFYVRARDQALRFLLMFAASLLKKAIRDAWITLELIVSILSVCLSIATISNRIDIHPQLSGVELALSVLMLMLSLMDFSFVFIPRWQRYYQNTKLWIRNYMHGVQIFSDEAQCHGTYTQMETSESQSNTTSTDSEQPSVHDEQRIRRESDSHNDDKNCTNSNTTRLRVSIEVHESNTITAIEGLETCDGCAIADNQGDIMINRLSMNENQGNVENSRICDRCKEMCHSAEPSHKIQLETSVSAALVDSACAELTHDQSEIHAAANKLDSGEQKNQESAVSARDGIETQSKNTQSDSQAVNIDNELKNGTESVEQTSAQSQHLNHKSKLYNLFTKFVDPIRSILSELILYPLLIATMFQFVTGQGYKPSNVIDNLSLALFVINSLFLVAGVYLVRVIILVTFIRAVMKLKNTIVLRGVVDGNSVNQSVLLMFVWTMHIIGQMITQLSLIALIGVRIHFENETANDSLNVSWQLWLLIIGGFFFPILGTIVFFCGAYYVVQDFSLGLFLGLLGLLERHTFPDAIFKSNRINQEQLAKKLIEEIHYKEVQEEYDTICNKINVVERVSYSYRNPFIVAISVIYLLLLCGYLYCVWFSTSSTTVGTSLTALLSLIASNWSTLSIAIYWISPPLWLLSICVLIIAIFLYCFVLSCFQACCVDCECECYSKYMYCIY